MALVFGKPLTPAQRLERNVQIIMGHPSVISIGPVIVTGKQDF